MFEEQGVLPIGVEFEGKRHADFILRPAKVKDSMGLQETEEGRRAAADDEYMGIFLIAIRLVKLGDIPREMISASMISEMYDDDLKEILAADARLANAMRSFREQNHTAASTDSGAHEDGVPGKTGAVDGRTGGAGLAGGVYRDQESREEREKDVSGPAAPEAVKQPRESP